MFVTNHVLSGVLIGQAMPGRPLAAFAAGVGSHLVLDAAPHWGCDFHSPEGPDLFLKVARRDGLLGLATMAAAAMAVNREARLSTIAAMAGAALLDLDKPLEHFFGLRPFPEVVTRLHKGIQNESVDGMRNEFAYGMAFALADMVAVSGARRRRSKQPALARRPIGSDSGS
ncbi:MAG: hypothetical protein ABSC41_12485 [Acidimicrobiales bacterium]|jgi:hypothetical protein